MIKQFLAIIMPLFFASCINRQQADKLFYNGNIQTVDSAFTQVEAMAVKDGKILAVGSANDLENNFTFTEKINLNGKYVYPGLIDAHCHFYGLGTFTQRVDLTACKNFSEVVDACIKFYAKNNLPVLLGRGWDQNKWPEKKFPVNDELNLAFTDIPVLLKRVDGHAAIANNALLKLAGFNTNTKIKGGDLIIKNNKLTGVLIDNAVDSIEKFLPKPNRQQIENALIEAQKICFNYGITNVHDAGLEPEIIEIIDSMQQSGTLKMRMYVMVSISNKNIAWLAKREGIKTSRLNVNSFKMYADGALGSRGALLIEPYHDDSKNNGLMVTDINDMEAYVKSIATTKFQLNTHCIGDAANRKILELYGKYLGEKNQRRWRIEHAQVIHPNDFVLYKKYAVVPSVQPTHATSDMHWAENRLGKNRIKYAYAYKLLMEQNGWIPLGTDFPVEQVSPFYTFDAAVSRKDANGFPIGGFEPKQALSRKEALLGMTLWAAQAAFEETEKGSLQPGKLADFILLEHNLLEADLLSIRNQAATAVYLNAEKVK